MREYANSIFFNGTIITMDEKLPEVEAIAVKGNRILAVGDYNDLLEYKNEDTKVVDLEGKTLLPGFIEPHTHFDLAAIFYDWVDISGFTNSSKEMVIDKLKESAKNTPKGDWVVGFGHDCILIRDLKAFTRFDLDEISTDHPIMVIIQSMHTAYVNSRALELLNVNKDTPDPAGGKYKRDEDGNPNGILIEQAAAMPFLMHSIKKSKKSPKELLKQQFNRYKEAGITAIWNAGYTPVFQNFLDTMKEAVEAEDCPIRVSNSVTYYRVESGEFNPDTIEPDTDKLSFAGYKFFYDGSPYTANMLLKENYVNSELMQDLLGFPKDQAGESIFTKEVFLKLLYKYHNMGKQVAIHCQGDRAAVEVLDCLEEVLAKYPREDHRHRLEHCALIEESEIKRAAKLGVALSFHSNHILYYGEALKKEIIGEERAARLMPAKTALKYGTSISFHTDSPMYPAEPLSLIRTAAVRKTRQGNVIGENERISVHEAIKGVTIGAAYQLLKDNDFGSIEVGKFADFVLLQENPYKVNVEDIDKIKIITTYLSGKDTNRI